MGQGRSCGPWQPNVRSSLKADAPLRCGELALCANRRHRALKRLTEAALCCRRTTVQTSRDGDDNLCRQTA